MRCVELKKLTIRLSFRFFAFVFDCLFVFFVKTNMMSIRKPQKNMQFVTGRLELKLDVFQVIIFEVGAEVRGIWGLLWHMTLPEKKMFREVNYVIIGNQMT